MSVLSDSLLLLTHCKFSMVCEVDKVLLMGVKGNSCVHKLIYSNVAYCITADLFSSIVRENTHFCSLCQLKVLLKSSLSCFSAWMSSGFVRIEVPSDQISNDSL